MQRNFYSMKKNLPIILSIAMLSIPAAYGHKVPQRRPITDLNSELLYKSLDRNTHHQFAGISKPSFAFASKNSKFVMSVGGFVKLTAGEDIGHPVESPDLMTTADIPMHDMDGNGAAFKMSARQTQLYLNMVALPGTADEVGAFVSANLINDYVPSLVYAYLRYRGIQAGYDYTLFSDTKATPSYIDYEGPNAATPIPTTGIRYTVDFGKEKNWKFAIGAELPIESYTTTGRLVSVSQRVPDFPVALQYQWDGGDSWIRASGVVRNLYYRDAPAQSNVDKVGFGVQLSGGIAITPRLTAYYQGVYGKGIASYIQDCSGLGLDLCPSADGKSMEAVPAWGAYGALQYQISDKVSCSGTYSHVRTYADNYGGGTTPRADQYRYAQYVNGNVMWDINSYFSTGVEYIWGRRVNYDGTKCADNRIQAMVQFAF